MRPLGLLALLAACTHTTRSPSPTPPPPVTPDDVPTLGTPDWRTYGAALYLEVADDGSAIAVGQHGGVIAFAPNGERRAVIPVAAEVYEAARDGGALELAQDADRAARVDLAARTATQTTARPSRIESIARAGTMLVTRTAGEAPLELVDTRTQAHHTLVHSRGYANPRIVGDHVIAGRPRHAVGIWDVATGARHRVFSIGINAVYALAPDGNHVATGTFTDAPNRWAVALWNVETGERSGLVDDFTCNPDAIAISPDGATLAIACADEVRLVRVPDAQPLATLAAPGFAPRTIAWSPNSHVLAVGTGDNTVHVYRAPAWEPVTRHLVGSRGEIRAIAVAGRFLVARGCCDDTAWLWVTDRRKPVIDFGGAANQSVAAATIDAEGHALVARVFPGLARIERWDLASRAEGFGTPITGRGRGLAPLVHDVGWSGRGAGAAWVLADNTLYALDPAGEVAWRFTLGPDSNNARATASRDGFSVLVADGGQLAVVGPAAKRVDAQAKILDCGIAASALSPDGRHVAVFDDHGLQIRSVARGLERVASIALAHKPFSEVALAWTSDTEVAAVADGALVLWKIGATTAHAMPAPNVTALAVSGGDAYLGRADGVVEQVALERLVARATSAFAAKPAADCVEEPSGGFGVGMLGAIGDAGIRGRLDDDGAYDEPEPPPAANLDVPDFQEDDE